MNEPFNRKEACKSWSQNFIGSFYNIGVDSQGRNLLTNQLGRYIGSVGEICDFSISELEVWKVKIVGSEKMQK